jgi:hypothetical protein
LSAISFEISDRRRSDVARRHRAASRIIGEHATSANPLQHMLSAWNVDAPRLAGGQDLFYSSTSSGIAKNPRLTILAKGFMVQ